MVERILWWLAFLTISLNMADEHDLARFLGLVGACLATYWVIEELYEWGNYKWRVKKRKAQRG